jgi:hypothetical protein
MVREKHTDVEPLKWEELESYIGKPVYYFSDSCYTNYLQKWIIIDKLIISLHRKYIVDILDEEYDFSNNIIKGKFYNIEVY